MKGKGERERYTQLNVELQRIARRDKKAFLNEQCKEIRETERIGNTKGLLKKTGDIKRTFHAMKDRSSNVLTEAEQNRRRRG